MCVNLKSELVCIQQRWQVTNKQTGMIKNKHQEKIENNSKLAVKGGQNKQEAKVAALLVI